MYYMKKNHYDVVVIGAGSAGLTSGVGFAKTGSRVLLVEKEHMGGECTNTGCIPSKALLHHARAYYEATKIAGNSTTSKVYRDSAFTYTRGKIADILAEETPDHFTAMGIDVVMGEAEFISRCAIAVQGVEYTFKKAIIASGSLPRVIDIPGLNSETLLTNQNLFALSHIPEKVVVLGAGPIGLEMGQALAMLGSTVTLVTNDDGLAKREDEALRPHLEAACKELGITTLTNAAIKEIKGTTALISKKDGSELSIPFDYILMAIGRVPHIPKGLEAAKINATNVGITIDSQHRTSNKAVYAIGDVAHTQKFTHVADDTARQVVTRVVSRGLLRVKEKTIPKVTYTFPELAQTGLSFADACAQYRADTVVRIEVPYSKNDRAKTDSAQGVLVVVAKKLSGKVLGAHIAGANAGELISIFTLAIDQKISLWRLQKLIYPYPTYSLLIKKAADQFIGQQLSTLKQDLLQVVKHALPKLIAFAFWASLIVAFQNYRISNNLSYAEVLFALTDFFTSTMWGPVLYMTLYAVRPLILFPATLLTALSGTLFGFWWGVLFTVIGENASANFAYSIGRFFGKDWKLEHSAFGNWITALREKPFESVLFMRLFYFPFDLTNYGAGILSIPWRSYFMATLIGIMPGLMTFVALGAALDLETLKTKGVSFDVLDPRYLALTILLFISSIILSKYLKKKVTV
jgi:pyruvate/2-oxoglutarate dehydrogenase complex dihydrolipoamide dehydrogenase (E3) component/uncharacterized membrane protein YdjX (TVP38/TMEM64 family)